MVGLTEGKPQETTSGVDIGVRLMVGEILNKITQLIEES